MNKADILGTEYTILDNCDNQDIWGATDETTKEIFISKIDLTDKSLKDMDKFIKKVKKT